MSSLFIKENVVLISHKDYLSIIYKDVKDPCNTLSSFKILSILFCITSQDNDRISLKRSLDYNKILEETSMVKERLNKFVTEVPDVIKNALLTWNVAHPSAVRSASKELFESTCFNHSGLNGGNNSSECLKCNIKDEYYLIPPNCDFFCGDVAEQCRKLTDVTYDILIADPPWWNKFIRRLRAANDKMSYSMMYNEDIASIPVKHLLSENCLIAVWCTNSESNISAVKEVIFPKWGVKYAAMWYWVKIKTSMETICEFSSGCRKQPYERIILGTVGNVRCVPDNRIVVSVPSALHSHKPPLIELLSPYVEVVKPRTLELFARYLLPNTTSVGYEPLKWQHLSLYETVI